jgi:hypothetical protein
MSDINLKHLQLNNDDKENTLFMPTFYAFFGF